MDIDPETQKWTRNASDDLAVERGCYFSPKHGEQTCHFIESFCVLSKGRWSGQKLALFDWQRDLLMRAFGWRQADGRRRFRRVYLEVAKKNGKSSLISAISLYLLLADKEPAAEVYLNACDRDQASIVFEEAKRMVEASPALRKRADCVPSKKVITSGYGRIVTNSSDAAKTDGLNSSGIIFDELHLQPDRQLWNVMEYAGAAREQPFWISITTAGEEEDGVWFEQREYSEKVEAGIIPDVTHLGIVHRALPTDDIDDPETWRKANPSLGLTISEDDFRRELEEAKLVPAKLANFKRLRLNLVVQGESKFFDMAAWDACGEDWFTDGQDEDVYFGLDLSSSNDLTALCGIWGSFTDGFSVGVKFWLPEGLIVRLEDEHRVPYRAWADEGHIVLTPGNVIDEDFVIEAVADLAATHRVKSLYLDPWNARTVGPKLAARGVPVEDFRQGYASLSAPTKMLQDLVTGGKIRHRNHPILRWHASNCVAKLDPAGNVKLDKSKRRNKIDGIAALVNAIGGALGEVKDPPLIHDDVFTWVEGLGPQPRRSFYA